MRSNVCSLQTDLGAVHNRGDMVTGSVGVSRFLSLGLSYFCNRHARGIGTCPTVDITQNLTNEITVRVSERSGETLAYRVTDTDRTLRECGMKG